MQKILAKWELDGFISKLKERYEIIAPLKINKVTKYEKVSDTREINFKELTLMPVKQFFIPEGEELFAYKNKKIVVPESANKKRIIFGLRKCDINALLVLDKVMFDPLYIAKRKNTLLIGMFCENPDKYCFCNSMELVDGGYDLYFYPEKNYYYISVGSKEGEKLVKDLKTAKKEVIKKEKNFKTLKNKDILTEYKNPAWKADIDKCLSCTACTVYCPTCNCYDIKDVMDLQLNSGKRIRKATSCQLKGFSQVAGGKSFRDSRDARFKHFVYHKIVFYKNKFNRYMCVGCGRCLRVCPTKIDWVDTINKIKEAK